MNRLAWAALFVLCSCGSTRTQTRPAALPTATGQVAAPPSSSRGASSALLKAWPINADSVVYLDSDGLAHTKLFEGLVAGLTAIPSLLTQEQATCARSLITSAKDGAVGMRGEAVGIVVRFDSGTPELRACLSTLNVSATLSDDGILRYANQKTDTPTAHPIDLASLSLENGEYLVGRLDASDGTRADVKLSESDEHFAVRAKLDLPDEKTTSTIARGLTFTRDTAKQIAPEAKPDELDALNRLIGALHVTRTGTHLDVLFDLREPVLGQAHDIGVATALAIYGVRRYLLDSKKAEALNMITFIARAIAENWERDPKKKLKSFPPVPKTVPRGVKYTSTPDDWMPWDALKLTMDQPQYFQYEVKAAPDGMSADVIAHGDLNGDGKASTFKLALHVDRHTKKVVVALAPVITDGDE
jgi:hypothetical protein